MINKRFLPWFVLAILLVIIVGGTAFFSLQKEAGMQEALFTVGIGTLLILLTIAGLIYLVITEYRNRVEAEKALNEKYAELDRINDIGNSANWLLDGMRQINDGLMGNDTLRELVQSTLDVISIYLQLPAAVCYAYDKEYNELSCVGAVALNPSSIPSIQLGEGLVGAAANRKQITVIKSVPDGYWQIVSGNGMATPNTLVFLPLWKKAELIGIIELGCFEQDVERAVKLLESMEVNIALAISAAQLLAVTQSQRDILETQQEELRQSNDELGMQAEELRASEEDLKTKEEELTLINQELEEKTEALEIAGLEMRRRAEELERSGKYKSEFLANMSHELRTPLNSILILTALMQENKDKNLTKRQEDNLSIVYKSGTDLLELINDVLDLSKIEAGKVDFDLQDVDLKELANDMQRAFEAVATKKRVKYRVSIDSHIGAAIRTDKQRLGQVIKNLLSNAFKFTPDGGRVDLSFERTGSGINIKVTDTGIGIAEEKQQLIFEAFQQADGATTRRYGGTGLGLSISRELVSKLGGRISVESKPNEGSTFIISLPPDPAESLGAAPVAFAEGITEQTQIPDDRALLLPSQRSILIIEDDVNFARVVNDLAVERGFKTIIALSGDEGLHYARKYRPSAIVLDLALPVISGQHILKTIKADPELFHIPVHVISAADGSDLPANDIQSFIQKPVQRDQLTITLSSIETYIKQHYKKVLILSRNGSVLQPFLSGLATSALTGTLYDITTDINVAQEKIGNADADCLIVDIGEDRQLALEELKQLRAASPGAHIIACFDHQLSAADHKQFQPLANALIGPSTQAGKRLLDEVEHFLKRMDQPDQLTVPELLDPDSDNILAGKTVLLADDDMRNIYALSALLENHGMKVLAAEHGKEALELLAQNPKTDLILMDIMMPEWMVTKPCGISATNRNMPPCLSLPLPPRLCWAIGKNAWPRAHQIISPSR